MADNEQKQRPEGQQINLDDAEGTIIEGYLEDSIYAPCTFLSIVFECKEKLTFGADNNYYLTYKLVDWVPVSFSESTGNNNAWHYELSCYPRRVFEMIVKPAKNTQELARAMSLVLSEGSKNLELPVSIINEFAGRLLQEQKLFSFDLAYKEQQMNKALCLYAGTDKLFSTTWGDVYNQEASTLVFDKETQGSNLITKQNYQFENFFSSAYGGQYWKLRDYLDKLIGVQFKVETGVPAFFLCSYTIKLPDRPEFDTGLPFVCVYSKMDITQVNAFVHVFANLKYME